MIKKAAITFVCIQILSGCKGNQGGEIQDSRLIMKDTINVVDIVSDLNKRLKSTGKGVDIQFFDKRHESVVRLSKGDTFFVQVNYISDTFIDLAKNHSIELYHAKGDFNFLGNTSRNQYKIAVGTNADTIEFDVVLKSKKYIFNDYYMKNGQIQYQLTDKISLCRLIELPKHTSNSLNSKSGKSIR
jgi:hypothetical protein